MLLPVSFILGMPGEDAASCSETVEFCVRNNIPLKSLMFATPYPGTKIFEYAVSAGRIAKDCIHDFVVRLEDARDFMINLTDAFTDDELVRKRSMMIEEVTSRVKPLSAEAYMRRLRNLFGNLASEALADETLVRHRAQHGGLDIF